MARKPKLNLSTCATGIEGTYVITVGANKDAVDVMLDIVAGTPMTNCNG